MRLFYHVFYGEGFVVKPGMGCTREADPRPFAGDPPHPSHFIVPLHFHQCMNKSRTTSLDVGPRCWSHPVHNPLLLYSVLFHCTAGIVWSGEGSLNGQQLDCRSRDCKEFLLAPGHPMQLCNSSTTTELMVFAVFPLTHAVQ